MAQQEGGEEKGKRKIGFEDQGGGRELGGGPEPAKRRNRGGKGQVGKNRRQGGRGGDQLFGGMGMMEETPVSHYAKRIVMIDHWLGDREYHLGILENLIDVDDHAA